MMLPSLLLVLVMKVVVDKLGREGMLLYYPRNINPLEFLEKINWI